MMKKCSKCGEGKSATNFAKNRRQCKKCVQTNARIQGRLRKERLVEHFGGKCLQCEYDKCPAALDFHHINPEEKKFRLSGNELRRAFAALIKEAKKCMLLCANCHRELHYYEPEEY